MRYLVSVIHDSASLATPDEDAAIDVFSDRLQTELDGPEVALAAIDRLGDKLTGYHAYHAARADLLRRLGRGEQSRAAYDKAIELAGNTAEAAYLTRRRDQVG